MRFIAAQYAPTTATLLFVYSKDVIVDKFSAINLTNAPATITVYMGGTDAHQVVYTATVPARAFDLCHPVVGQDLKAGEGLYVMAGTADAISVRAGGRVR